MNFFKRSAERVFLSLGIILGAVFSNAICSHPAPPPSQAQGARQAVKDISRLPRSKAGKTKPSPAPEKRPLTLLIGDFVLTVESYSDTGSNDPGHGTITGASGTAWLTFTSDVPTLAGPAEVTFQETPRLFSSEKVAPALGTTDRQLKKAPDATRFIEKEKATVKALGLAAKKDKAIISLREKDMTASGARLRPPKGEALLRFEDITISSISETGDKGRVTSGKAVFPAGTARPAKITLERAGFTIWIKAMEISPAASSASVTLTLPSGVGTPFSCTSPSLEIGAVTIRPDASFYAERPSNIFGPWIVGITGLVASGSGFTADFSSSMSPVGRPTSFKGLVLKEGTASGAGTNPSESNTGFMAAQYQFPEATITAAGFEAALKATVPFEFVMINPKGYRINAQDASVIISEGAVSSGVIGPGKVTLPIQAVRAEANPATDVQAAFTSLVIKHGMGLSGEVVFDPPNKISWGELTHPGSEIEVWNLTATTGYLYAPAEPLPTFSPDDGAAFLEWHPSSTPSIMLSEMETRAITGIVVGSIHMDDLVIFSSDRPTGNPLTLRHVEGWIRIGGRGVDGDIRARPQNWNAPEPLGNKSRAGYVGGDSFDARIGIANKEKGAGFKFASSAVYDSEITGLINLKAPSEITGLAFSDMKCTSTADLAGGNIVLPSAGVTLGYWKLFLVPTGDPAKAGVMSARTGRIIFTAAGISETRHFEKPFRLTWGEMLADGNLGELFLDNNSYGQRFDKIKFSPSALALSKYTPGATDGYLATCGSIYINFFGSAFVNIRDARYDVESGKPYFGRSVTIPKTGMPKASHTNLHLHGNWDDLTGERLSTLDFPDADMDYNIKIQNGLTGTGAASVSFVHSDDLDATIEIRDESIDICMTSTSTHDVDMGLYARLGGLSHINGCIRIMGPTLQRLVLGGYLEKAVGTGTGILAPKTGQVVEVITSVTPNSCSFYASGDMLFSVAGAAVDLSGTVFLKKDFSRKSAEGDVTARINCNSVLGGLEGEGQVSWYADMVTQFLQGRLAVTVAGWTGGAGLEGGMFVGHNVPKAKAWVLQTTTGRFGVSQAQLPDTLTGIYGYGQVSFAVNWYIFGGGIELYAGLGAFSVAPPGLSSAWPDLAIIGLPYVLGSAGVCVHGEILGGLVSASGWCNLAMGGPVPITFEGTFGLEGCVLWVICASVDVTAGLGPGGFYIN